MVELLERAFESFIDDPYCIPDEREFADHLIAHGVTVQDNTEISDELLERLRKAPVTVMTEEPTVEVVQEWISVKDRLPQEKGEICKNVILFMDDGLVTVGWLNEDRGSAYMLDTRNDFISKVPMLRCTHWMPLPHPPKGE